MKIGSKDSCRDHMRGYNCIINPQKKNRLLKHFPELVFNKLDELNSSYSLVYIISLIGLDFILRNIATSLG